MKYLSDKLFAYFPYVFSFMYFILLMFVETSILYAFQNKSFLLSKEYLTPFLAFSGGFMDYLGIFFSEILRFNFPGALLYSLITLASILLYKRLLVKTGVTKNLLLITLYPFIILVLLVFNQFHPLAMNLKLLLGLILLQFLVYGLNKGIFLKIISIVTLVAYWYLCGLEFFMIVFFYLAIHITIHKTFIKNIIVLVFSAISVLILNTFVFYTPLMVTFIAIDEVGTEIPYMLLITFLLFMLTPITAVIKLNVSINHALQLLIILGIGYLMGVRSFNKINHTIGKFLVAGNNNDYNKVLQLRENTRLNTRIISAYTNLALMNKRKLLDQMFKYNQKNGREGLLTSIEFDSFNEITNMKMCFNMGLSNHTIRWAMEAVTSYGYNAEILQHLILAHLLNDNVKAAEKYYSMFENTLFNNKQKNQTGKILGNYKNGNLDKLIVEKRRLMPKNEFLFVNQNDKKSFTWASEANNNPKAFELYVAICLLENDYEAVKDVISRFRALGYKKLPIHVQEALCLFYSKGKEPPELYGFQIDPHIMQNCAWFFQTINRYNNNLQAAHDELIQRTGNTFWFYLFELDKFNQKKE